MADPWPFDDADQDDPLAKLRIPVVRTISPRWRYEVCLLVAEEPEALWRGFRPDEREVAQFLAELDYRMAYYSEGWKRKMRQRPLDVDGTTNTVLLWKRAEDGDWCFNRASWQHGPPVIPERGSGWTLEQVLDRVNDVVPEKWAAWKARYPQAFGTEASRG